MTELTILRGVPASGKSTWAKEHRLKTGAVIVNRDDIRMAMFGKWTGVDEEIVTHAEHGMIDGALTEGRDTVVDATNLNNKFVRKILHIAAKHRATVKYVDFPVSMELATQNDLSRVRQVGEKVIKSFFKRYKIDIFTGELKAPPAPFDLGPTYTPIIGKPFAYGFDIDGTLANHLGIRNPYDTTKYHLDTVHYEVQKLARAVHSAGYRVIVLTGRSAEFRTVVQEWLTANGIPYDELLMRPAGDQRDDSVIKAELFDQFIAPKYHFLAQFDDRNRVVNGLRSKGITVMQVRPGSF